MGEDQLSASGSEDEDEEIESPVLVRAVRKRAKDPRERHEDLA